MKTLYVDCSFGIASDMLCGALLDMCDDKNAVLRKLDFYMPKGVILSADTAQSYDIQGTAFRVRIDDEASHCACSCGSNNSLAQSDADAHRTCSCRHDEGEHDEDEHDEDEHDNCSCHNDGEHGTNAHGDCSCHGENAHGDCSCHGENAHGDCFCHGEGRTGDKQATHCNTAHTHSHTTPQQVFDLLYALKLPSSATRNAARVYRNLTLAEAAAHSVDESEVHFHEVGSLRAVASVVALALLFDEIGAEKVVFTPVNVGCGTVQCDHGTMDVPTPATAYLIKDIPTFFKPELRGEMCTPSGAAIAKTFASEFGVVPRIRAIKQGVGIGTRDIGVAGGIRTYLFDLD